MRHTPWMLLLCLLAATVAAAGPAPPARPARGPPDKVTDTLREVSNLKRFQISAAQKKMLARNLFTVRPTDEQQLFFLYENNDYGNIPSFITTDLVLHLYHIFYDYTLRRVEKEKLLPLVESLAGGMLRQSVLTWQGVADPQLKDAALRNVAYFGVATQLLGLKVAPPQEARRMVEAEVARIGKHGGFAVGSIFPYNIDYSQFVPRGHYTRTPAFQRYFRTMMWFGLAPFSFYRLAGNGRVRSDQTVRMGLLWVRDLYQANLQGAWERAYEPTAFYVGLSDDLTPAEYKALMDEVFGKGAPISVYTDPARFAAFVQRGKARRLPLITPRLGDPGLLPFPDPQTAQLRFMGQRYIPDSEMLQRLSMPLRRPFPAGMDVFAVLGSARASWLLDTGFPTLFDTKRWPSYRPEREKLTAQFARLDEKAWTRNLYTGWLWALQALTRRAGAGYPSFMRNSAWEDKSLNTALASWAELRHDTILYAKQSYAPECGGDEPPPPPKGYVEPNVEFYRRVQTLVRLSREGLARRGLITDQVKERFETFEDLVAFLRRVSEKELAGRKLTREEYDQIRITGAEVERMTLAITEGQPSSWHEITSETDKDMAVIADVHTAGPGGETVLEEGVGHANEILVIVPVEGRLQISRGATFSYYEFKHPASDRLTDEKWQGMLKSGKEPAPPAWTRSFLLNPKGRKGSGTPMKIEVYSTGC